MSFFALHPPHTHLRSGQCCTRRPAGFTVAPAVEEPAAREEDAPGDGGSGEDSDSDDDLPPLEANMNRAGGTFHSSGHGVDRAAEEEEDGSGDDSSQEGDAGN